ncbi:MAG TPA: hypothetical protein VNI77_11530 [Nitrososphaera sp.]|nr:hypothetical protein [Nitrososphaera sp.]
MKKERYESRSRYHNRGADIFVEYARRLRNGGKVGISEPLGSIVSMTS